MYCITLAVSTLDRVEKLARLLLSLQDQTFRDFEVVIVDQNPDDRLAALCLEEHGFPLRRLYRPDIRGISTARNIGWQSSSSPVLIFPDDDSWYPPDFLARGLAELARLRCDLLSGRAAMPDGRGINGRYADTAHAITRSNVWISQMEWVTFYRRGLLEQLSGFDEMLGIGSPGPWQAAEGCDFILRAIEFGANCRFDPEIVGYHEEIELNKPDPGTPLKMRGYARGMGRVLRCHGYGVASIAYWISRPLFNIIRYSLAGRLARANVYLNVAIGRYEGWIGRTPGKQNR